MKSLIICFSLIINSFHTTAQNIKASPYEIGFHLGTALYTGDITSTLLSSYKSPGLFFGFDGIKKLNDAFSIRASISFGKLTANDANYSSPEYKQQRNFSFKTPVTELSASIVWNPLSSDRRLTPYLFVGGGFTFLKIKRDYSNLNPDYFINDDRIVNGLPLDTAYSLPKIIAVAPVGAGLRYSLSKKISATLETSYRLMSSDYLDGFSQAANPNKKDNYFTHTIGLIYSFGEKDRLACPKKKF